MSTSLTPVRKQVLLLLAKADVEGREMRISNETNAACLHWKPADWLIQSGLAEKTQQPTGEYLILTAAGRDVATAVAT